MELFSRFVIIVFGIWLLWVSGAMVTRPSFAIACLRKFASTNLINYTEISLRFIVGAAFFSYAPHSNYMTAYQIIGIFLAVTAGVLMLIPRRWHHNYALWWADKLTYNQVVFCAPFSFVTGVLVIALSIT